MKTEELLVIDEALRHNLINMAQRFVSSWGTLAEAEDIVQESLIVLWHLMEDGYPVKNINALAGKIVRTRCISSYRRRKILQRPLLGDDFLGGTPASSIIDEQDAMLIKDKLYGGLSDTQRLFLDLRNEEGMSLDEMSALTGKPKTSIKTSISAARHQMLEQLKKEL